MNFEETPDQKMLRTSLAQFLARSYRFEDRVKASRTGSGWREDVWRTLGDQLGLFSLGIAEELGGVGGSGTEQMIVMEECGRALVLEPVAETLFEGAPLLAKSDTAAARELLMRIPGGAVRLAIGVAEVGAGDDFSRLQTRAAQSENGWRITGTKCIVPAAPAASHLIVAARVVEEIALFLLPANTPGLSLHRLTTIDGRLAADVVLRDVLLPPEACLRGNGLTLLEEWRDRAIAAMSAEAVGVLGHMLDATITYAKERQQFGQPIGSFQALQHRLVDMYLQLEMLRSAALVANLTLGDEPRARARAASAAKVTLAEACRFIGQNAVQLHGAMGMTDELAIGHYFKRATAMEHAFGRADWHRARHARLQECAPVDQSDTKRATAP